MAQVTDNPDIADGSSIHQEAKQMDLKNMLYQVNSRKPRLVQQLGTQQVQHILQIIFGNEL